MVLEQAGSTRVRISFPDNTLQNTWLRVTVVANADTGLAANDVFYFGNVIGDFDVGNTSTRIRVNALDTSAVRNNQSPGANSAGVTNIFDLNRDGRVNALDTSIVRNNQQASGIVAPITAPSAFGPLGGREVERWDVTHWEVAHGLATEKLAWVPCKCRVTFPICSPFCRNRA